MNRRSTKRLDIPFAVIALALGALGSKPAVAGTVIDIYDGRGTADFTPLNTFFGGFGYTVNQLTSSFTTLAGANFVDLNLLSSVSSAQLTAITAYVNGGGRLLLNAEYNTYSPNGITPDNQILAALGSTMSILSTSSVTGYHDTNDIVANAFTAGVADINYGDTSSISLGSGTALAYGDPATDNSQLFIAYQAIGSGYVFVITDSDTADNINSTGTNNNGVLYCNFAGVGCAATNAVPEPSSMVLLGTVLGGAAAVKLLRRKLVS